MLNIGSVEKASVTARFAAKVMLLTVLLPKPVHKPKESVWILFRGA